MPAHAQTSLSPWYRTRTITGYESTPPSSAVAQVFDTLLPDANAGGISNSTMVACGKVNGNKLDIEGREYGIPFTIKGSLPLDGTPADLLYEPCPPLKPPSRFISANISSISGSQITITVVDSGEFDMFAAEECGLLLGCPSD